MTLLDFKILCIRLKVVTLPDTCDSDIFRSCFVLFCDRSQWMVSSDPVNITLSCFVTGLSGWFPVTLLTLPCLVL